MDYNAIANNVVIKNISSFGAIRILESSVGTSLWVKKYDPVKSSNYWENSNTGEIVFEEPTASVTSNSVKMLKSSLSNKLIDGETFKSGDVLFYMGPEVAPNPIDAIIENGIKYAIYKVDELKPADVVLMYTVYARTI